MFENNCFVIDCGCCKLPKTIIPNTQLFAFTRRASIILDNRETVPVYFMIRDEKLLNSFESGDLVTLNGITEIVTQRRYDTRYSILFNHQLGKLKLEIS